MTNSLEIYNLQLPSGMRLVAEGIGQEWSLHLTAGLSPFENEKRVAPLKLDFEKQWEYHLRTFVAHSRHPFGKVMKAKNQLLLEACGGWGGDSLLWLFLGHRLMTWERHPVVAAMLEEARARALHSSVKGLKQAMENWTILSSVFNPSVDQLEQAQAIYLDPMYPEHQHRKTKPVKEMLVLRALVGDEVDGSWSPVQWINFHGPVIVKRQPLAPMLWDGPHHQIKSKAMRLDIYKLPK